MTEEWRDIKDYEGYYKVSNLGRIKSLERDVFTQNGDFRLHKKETIKTPKKTKDGYLSITLSVNGTDKTFPIHRLVAEAFLSQYKTSDKLEVNHKDTNRTNNIVSNLEWVSHYDNVQHSVRLGNYNCHKGVKNGRCIPVSVFTLENEKIKDFNYIAECAEWIKTHSNTRSNNVAQIASYVASCIKKMFHVMDI